MNRGTNYSGGEGTLRREAKASEVIAEASLTPRQTEGSFPDVSTILHVILPVRCFVKSLPDTGLCRRQGFRLPPALTG